VGADAGAREVLKRGCYRFNGIEHVEELGLDMAFYRSYDPAIGRWLQVDPKAESFATMSPYTGMGNNPILYTDYLDDSIRVAQEHRELMGQVLSAVFGDQASNFGYSSTGSTITNMIFGESTEITLNSGETITKNASEGGGALSVLVGENDVSENTILVDPNSSSTMKVMTVTSAYYNEGPIDPTGPPRFKPMSVQTNLADKTFHEIGHVRYRGKSQDKTLDFNNRARSILKLKSRPYDETHNRKVN